MPHSAGRDGGASGDGRAQGGQTTPRRESGLMIIRGGLIESVREIEDLLATGN